MEIIVLANDKQKGEILSKKTNDIVNIKFEEKFSGLSQYKNADAFFILNYEASKAEIDSLGYKPVFINSVESTLHELDTAENISRINAWPGFLKRDIWEIATQQQGMIKNIFNQLGWKYLVVKDEPGMVSARVIVMIINEAWYALGDNVSTKSEIDIAMKLGTNYSYGPFEWCEEIGLQNVFSLLKKLNKTDNRYTIAPALKMEFNL